MYFTYAQTVKYAQNLQQHLSSTSAQAAKSGGSTPFANTDVFLLPDHLSLATVANELSHSSAENGPRILYGAQNCHSEALGPYTGEVSPKVLAELGCTFVELGHAERRRLFAETDETTAAKAAAVAREGMTPLVCIGEVERGKGRDAIEIAVAQVEVQINAVLNAVPAGKHIVFAYEPVWAIGAAEPAEAGYVVGVVEGIRRVIEKEDRGKKVRILYGGSAKLGLMKQIGGAVDGLFLGRFAHEPEMAAKIIMEVAEA